MIYKEALKSDAEVLVEIYNSAFYDDFIRYGHCPAYGRSKENMEQSILDYPKTIAYDQERPVGVISFKAEGLVLITHIYSYSNLSSLPWTGLDVTLKVGMWINVLRGR